MKRDVLSSKRLDSSRPGKKRGYGVPGKTAPEHHMSGAGPYILLDAIVNRLNQLWPEHGSGPQSSLHVLHSWFWRPQSNGQKIAALPKPYKPSSKEKEYAIRDDPGIHNDLHAR